MKPTHKHDCDNCKLLLVTEEADWYHCKEDLFSKTLGGSVIGRYGSDGRDYWSLNLATIRSASEEEGSRFMKIAKAVDKLFLKEVVTP